MNKLSILLWFCLVGVFAHLAQSKAHADSQQHTKANREKPTIIALAPHVVEMLFAIGAGDQIIATLDHADYPEQAKTIPSIGNYTRVQIEKVVELNPDLIIAWRSGTPADDLKRLADLGFKVAYSQPKTLLDISAELLSFGKLTGNLTQAKQVTTAFTERLEAITQQYRSKTAIKVFYELWHEPLSTVAAGSWPQIHLDICGAQNVFLNAVNSYPQVSIEQVLKKQPQIIIQPLSINQTDKKGYQWSKWPVIHAVKNNQIIRPDADILHRMTPRVLDELNNLCQQIEIAREFYLKH